VKRKLNSNLFSTASEYLGNKEKAIGGTSKKHGKRRETDYNITNTEVDGCKL